MNTHRKFTSGSRNWRPRCLARLAVAWTKLRPAFRIHANVAPFGLTSRRTGHLVRSANGSRGASGGGSRTETLLFRGPPIIAKTCVELRGSAVFFMKRHLQILTILSLGSFLAAQDWERGLGGTPQARQQWFYSQRAYPLGYIPPGARVNAIGELERINRIARQQRRGPL